MYSVSSLLATAIILPLLGVLAVCMRLVVRLHLRRGLRDGFIGVDDWFIIAACFLVCVLGANQIVATAAKGLEAPGGLGRHTESAPDGDPIIDPRTYVVIKANYPQDVIEKPAYGFIKLSVLFFYRRIFGVAPRFRQATTFLIVLMTLWTIAFFFASVFVCGAHPASLWSFSSKEDRYRGCVDTSKLLLWFAITDVIGDIAILAMPYPQIRKLQIAKREKICLSAIMLLGTLSTIAGVVRLGFVIEAFKADYGQAGDISGQATAPWLWTTVESAVGLIAACLPPMGPLIRKSPRVSAIWSALRQAVSTHASHSKRSGNNEPKIKGEAIDDARPGKTTSWLQLPFDSRKSKSEYGTGGLPSHQSPLDGGKSRSGHGTNGLASHQSSSQMELVQWPHSKRQEQRTSFDGAFSTID